MARPPSSQPAACRTKFTPPSTVACNVFADSYAAWASGNFDAHNAPPDRNGTPSQLEAVGRAGSGGDRTHERLVAVAQVCVHHVEVALVDGNVDRLAHRATGVVQVGREVRQLDEVLEVGQRRVTATRVEIMDER